MSASGRRRLVWIVLAAVVALTVRARSASLLSLDWDEPIYLETATEYGRSMRAGDLAAVMRPTANDEHPPLVKLIMGLGIAVIGPDGDVITRLAVCRAIAIAFGVGLVILVAWLEPWAGLLLAVHTLHIKYSAQAYLDAPAAFFATVCLLAFLRSRGRVDRWFVASAIALGATCASKYAHGAVALVTLVCMSGWGDRLRVRHILTFLGIAVATFFALHPTLWPAPFARLGDSVWFHVDYAERLRDAAGPSAWWSSLWALFGGGPSDWHPDVFPLSADWAIAVAGLGGLIWGVMRPIGDGRAGERDRLLAVWFVVGLVLLVLWPTRWAQHTMVVIPALCMGAGIGLRRLMGQLSVAKTGLQ